MSTASTQAEAAAAAARYWRGTQSGPKPKSREAKFLADLLDEAAATLRVYAKFSYAIGPVIVDAQIAERERLDKGDE